MGRDLGEQDREFDFPQIQRKLQLTNKNAVFTEPPLQVLCAEQFKEENLGVVSPRRSCRSSDQHADVQGWRQRSPRGGKR